MPFGDIGKNGMKVIKGAFAREQFLYKFTLITRVWRGKELTRAVIPNAHTSASIDTLPLPNICGDIQLIIASFPHWLGMNIGENPKLVRSA